MLQEAAVKSRARASKRGMSSWWGEKNWGYQIQGLGLFHIVHKRGLWAHIKHWHKEVILQCFGILPWREQCGWTQGDQEKHIQSFPGAWATALEGMPAKAWEQHGVLPVWLHLCSLQSREPQRLLQGPSSLHRDKLNAQKRGQGKK